MAYTYRDANGDKIKKGDRVVMPCAPQEEIEDGTARGIILDLIDPEGDVDDEGRSVYYAPVIRVEFDNGEVDSYQMDTYGNPRQYYPDGVDDFATEEFVLLRQEEKA